MDVGNDIINFKKENTDDDDFSGKEESNTNRIKQLCRLCANVIDSATYIFDENERDECLANKINSCLPMTVKATDILPKQLCTSCVNKLHQQYEFCAACLKAEEKLKIESEKNICLDKLSSENLLLKNGNRKLHEIDLYSLNKENYSCPLCFHGNMIIYCDDDDDLDSEEHKEIGDEVSEYFEESVGLLNECNIVERTENCSLELVSQKDKEILSLQTIDVSSSDIKPITSMGGECINIQKEFIPEETVSICRLCGDLFKTIDSSYCHSLSHAMQDYYPCILCSSNFLNESELEKHFKEHQSNLTHLNDELSHQSRILKQCFECYNCKKVFSTKRRLSFHMECHSGSRYSTHCEYCSKNFENESLLYHHICSVQNSTSKISHCEICGKSFLTKTKLLIHRRNEHARERPFKCEDCGRCLSTKDSLMEHIESQHVTIKSFHCELCGIGFSHSIQLQNHIKSHLEHSEPQAQICYKCDECNAAFPDVAQCLQHGEIHVQFHIDATNVFHVFRCEYCESCYTSQEDLKQHLRHHTGESPYECRKCNSYFRNYYSLTKHKKLHLSWPSNNDAKFTIPVHFVCESCGKTFKQWEHMYIHRHTVHLYGTKIISPKSPESKRHLNIIHPFHLDQSVLCEKCGERFDSRVELTKHRREKHPHGNKYKCNECGKLLANMTGLIIHHRLHTGEKPFICDVCGKRFHQSSGMYTHRRIHTKECPYCCEICGSAFNVKGDLDNHRRSKHTKERPFKCDICQKSFLTSNVFYQHRILHTGVRKYKCSHCEKSFARWNALRLHTRTHTGEKPFSCTVCKRNFTQKGDMKKHMRTQHNIVEDN